MAKLNGYIAQNDYCSRDIYLQLMIVKYFRSVILPIIYYSNKHEEPSLIGQDKRALFP